VHQLLIDELGPILFDNRLSEDDLRKRVNEQLQAAVALERVPLSAADKARLIQDVTDDILGYGPIDCLLREEAVTEIMVNGPDRVFVERDGKLTKDPNVRFLDEDHVRRVIDKIVSAIGRRIDESTPMVDARLPDGSRVNAVIAPLAIGGPFLTIRKFSADPLQIEDLIRFGSVNVHAAEFLKACILGRLNGVVQEVLVPVRPRCSTCCRALFLTTSESSRLKMPKNSSYIRNTCCRWSHALLT
jgi:pilus assembly protein CpaF